MKVFLSIAATLLVLGSCSKSEVLNSNNGFQNDGKVRFAAASNKTNSRAATGNPIGSTEGLQNTVKKFNVYGYVTGDANALLTNTEVNWVGQSWEYSSEPYWPSSTMDFFAYANWTTAPTITSTGITATVTVAEDILDATGQKDLLVASAIGESKKNRTTLKFKHALTQVLFKTGNLDAANLEVRIGGARIVNISNTGTMSYASETAGIIWGNQTATNATYHLQDLQVTGNFTNNTVASDAITVPAIAEGTTLDKYTRLTKGTANTDNALLLVPQTFAAWTPSNAAPKTGAYIELLAVINTTGKMSTAGAVGDAKYYYAGTPAIGADGKNDIYGKIFIPVQSATGDVGEWVPGKRISYIITFGDKNSGSGGGGYDEDGEQVLVPIRFNATVEDWTNVDVPLLTAKFEATSDKVNATFINGFTQQLLFDISKAKDSKTYKASITISGKLAETSTITFNPTAYTGGTIEPKILSSSSVTYDFKGITDWAAGTISVTVPTGWEAKSYKGADRVSAIATVAAGASISVEGTNANVIVLTKK